MEFDARNFVDKVEAGLQEELWKFINEPENRIRLITACELRRPAVEGIALPLRERFGERLTDHNVRRLIGLMVKQVLAEADYIVEERGVRLRPDRVFTTGTRYMKKEKDD